ncbi:hypothetical protein KKA53_02245 [Candidatus Dependentiae bacterium]|nr:hypothetical protein [Candidatus Dependentiae bacterium]
MQAPCKTPHLLLLLFLALIPTSFAFSKSIVLFSPDDKPTKHLIQNIAEAKTRIYAAIYMLTDKKIALALIEAKKRGLDIQLITDSASAESPYGKVLLLRANGVETSVFWTLTDNQNKFNPLMHHKFAIIDNNVWTGSFNWTISANTNNQENVIYTDEKEVCDKYLAQFEKLKQRCIAMNEKKKHLQKQAEAQVKAPSRPLRGNRPKARRAKSWPRFC